YNISLDTYRTNLSVMKNERAEGREEGLIEGHKKGLVEGHKKGLAEANLAFATKMKSDGMPIDIIQKYTGLTADEIDRL
ncbi:MAG: Rpn family recombination-promoting nuclease/putative transposase, partial [Bacteroidaceae bacterium]|nr:Rpn family recombination-promoting nuclease/putative transposase [Bacteroidaceae bacterium]